jgi:DNA-binding helix-hairpin-helix protein with protein kinase domain
VKVPRQFLQQVVGYTAAGLAILFFPSLFVTYLAVFTLLGALVFGPWWLVLEVIRLRLEQDENRERQVDVAALREEADHREAVYDQAQRGLAQEEQKWKDAAASYDAVFRAKFQELRSLRDRYENLQHEYNADRQRLPQKVRAMQLAAHLQQAFVSDADIPDIGPTRKAVLASYGIKTAWDIEEARVLAVPGFGPELTRRLLQWRGQVETSFIWGYYPPLNVPASDQQALDRMYRQIRQYNEMRLLNGPAELRAISTTANKDLSQRYETVRDWVEFLAQAKVDLEVLPGDV